MGNRAIILLHEIYGKNCFIDSIERDLKKSNFDVYPVDFYNGKVFDYEDIAEAHKYFYDHVDDITDNYIINMAFSLKCLYEKVFIIGFSAGATVAYKCSLSSHVDKVICFYGSRIRDYLTMHPVADTLVLLADEDSYDVDMVAEKLNEKRNVSILRYPAGHGFVDPNSPCYDSVQAKKATSDAIYYLLH